MRKAILVWLCVAGLVMMGCSPAIDNADGFGSVGTMSDSWIQIWDWYDLDAIRHNLSGSHVLMRDLGPSIAGYPELAGPDANDGKGWEPIGATWEAFFAGRFDGQGHEIRDLFINRPDEDNVGLFGNVAGGGVVESIGVVDANVRGNRNVGSLAGRIYDDGTVKNAHATGPVGGERQVGGLAGYVGAAAVINSYAIGDVDGGVEVGGLVGRLASGTVSNCYSIGSVTGSSNHVGGLVGSVLESTVSDSRSSGSVSGDWRVGGLVGTNNRSTIRDSHATGNVFGSTAVGGLVGHSGGHYGAVVTSSYATGNVIGEARVGGLVGWDQDSIISNCYSRGNVTGELWVGGLIGRRGVRGYLGRVSNSYYDYHEVLVNGENIITVGAMVSEDFEQWLADDKSLNVNERLSEEDGYYRVDSVSDFKELLAFGQVSSLKFRLTRDLDLADEPDFYIPYLAGHFDGDGHTVMNLNVSLGSVEHIGLFGYLAGTARVSKLGVENSDVGGYNHVGSLAGVNARGTVIQCYASGTVSGVSGVGGLIGTNVGLLSNCYSTASVTGEVSVGGLTGHNTDGGWGVPGVNYIINCYSRGGVSGDERVGGLVGSGFVVRMSDNFWDVETSGVQESTGGTGKTTAEMQDIRTFSDPDWSDGLDAPWEITGVLTQDDRDTDFIWNIVDDQTYPFLSWELILNDAPIARASDISGQPQVMCPDEPYTVTARYFHPDGRDDLKYCYLRLLRPDTPLTMGWTQSTDDFWVYESDMDYLSVSGTSLPITEGGLEGYELAWTFTINDQWPEVENAIDFGVQAWDDSDLKSGWDYDDTKASFRLEPGLVDIVHVDSVFGETEVFYNPLLLPDLVYLYYSVEYTGDPDYFEPDTVVHSSENLPFSLVSDDGTIDLSSCRVFYASAEEELYVATLLFEVPFLSTATDYTLNMADSAVSVRVIPRRKDIVVEDMMTSYIGVGVGLAYKKFDVALLGQRVALQAGPSVGVAGGGTAGFESGIAYSGVHPDLDSILFGFPVGVSGKLEGKLTMAEAELPLQLLNEHLSKATFSLEGYLAAVEYPMRANMGSDDDLIAAFIIPMVVNGILDQPTPLQVFAPIVPEFGHSPYKELIRTGFSFSLESELDNLDIVFGHPHGAHMFKLPGPVFEAGYNYESVWEIGQENKEPIATHAITTEWGASGLVLEVLEVLGVDVSSWLGAGRLDFTKTGMVGNDRYVIESGYQPDLQVLEEGELYINRWEMTGADFFRLHENGSLSFENLPAVYEESTIVGTRSYQPSPSRFQMDVIRIDAALGLSADVEWSVEYQHKKRVPTETYYASEGTVYDISYTSADSIRDAYESVESYARSSMSVLFDSLEADLEAVREWLQEALYGVRKGISSVIGEMGKRLGVFIEETGEKVAEVATRVSDWLENLEIRVYTGFFNPPAAVNNADLDFASYIVAVDHDVDELIPEGTSVTIYPKDGVSLDELSDVSVYRFAHGYWTIIPSLQHPDGSFTFTLESAGIYALIHAFPDDRDFLTQPLVNMSPGSSYALTSDPVKNSDGSIAANTSFDISVMKAATLSSDGTTVTFGDSPVVFPTVAETDDNGQLSIPIESGGLEGEAYLRIEAESGYCAQIARIIVSDGEGIDDDFTVAIKMVQPAEGMAVVNQDIELQAITSYSVTDPEWRVIDSFGTVESYVGDSILFELGHSGVYSVYCFVTDKNGFTHTAYAELPVTDPDKDADGYGVSDDIRHYYGFDPTVEHSDELIDAMISYDDYAPPVRYTLTVSASVGGSATFPGEGMFPCDEGMAVNLVANPETGYQFVNWTASAGEFADASADATTFTMPSEAVTVTANFEEALTQCIPTDTATGVACFTTSHGSIEDLTAIPALSPAPRGVSFPHGMFAFRVTGLGDGATVTLTIELPEAVPEGFVWWKHDGTRWYSLPNLDDNGDNIMVIELTDGGLGDTPDSPDGEIHDPGGPGNPVPPLTVGWEGSSVDKAAVMAPWIVLLAAIAGATLLILQRRRAQI